MESDLCSNGYFVKENFNLIIWPIIGRNLKYHCFETVKEITCFKSW